MLSFCLQNINRSFFLTSKAVNMLHFVCCLFASKYVISAVSSSLTCNCISRMYVIGFWPWKNSFVRYFWIYDHCVPFLLLILRFLNAKYICYTLLVWWQSLKAQFLPFWKNFNLLKHQRYLLCCLLVSKYVVPTVFLHFNLKKHRQFRFRSSFYSKYSKSTLFLSL